MPPTSSHQPPLPLMHLCFLFSGAGTLLLGPTVPVFAQRWHLPDSGSGLLIAAQFFGLFLGAITLSHQLRRSLLRGCLSAAAGLLLLAFASSRPSANLLGTLACFALGFGLGHITTSVNILSAQRYSAPRQRSSALALLNFTWSAGAVLSPLIAALYLARASLLALLLTFASCAAVLYVAVAVLVPANLEREVAAPARASGMPLPPLLYVFVLFFLYGGFEATLGGWLSTYTLRYTSLTLADAAFCTTAMWAAFAAGRALAALILRVVPERAVRVAGILLTTTATIALRAAHTGPAIAACAAGIGIGIAPFFPVTFSLLITRAPTPRQAGAATANIGLGSAVFPYITGVVSTHLGSLHTAMLTPIAIALALLTLCWLQPSPHPEASAQ